MELTKIRDITSNKQEQTVNLRATVTTRSPVKAWKTERYSGTRIGGILSDDSGTIDFVCFTDAVNKFYNILKENNTYTFKHVKVGRPNKQYAKTKHACEIYFEVTSTAEKEDIPPYSYTEPFNFTAIKDLAQEPNLGKVTVIGKVIELPSKPESFFDSDILKVIIQDQTGKIQYSLIGNSNKKINFGLGATVILNNITHKIFGDLHCLDGRTGIRIVNPTDTDYSQHLPHPNSPCVDMSPGRERATQVPIVDLHKDSGRASITTHIVSTNLKNVVYTKCPLVKCNSKVNQLDNKLWRCNKCQQTYHLSTYGLRLILDVGDGDASKSLLLFNQKAEQFLKTTTEILAHFTSQDIDNLEKTILGAVYKFVVKPSQTDGEFFIESFELQTTPSPPATIPDKAYSPLATFQHLSGVSMPTTMYDKLQSPATETTPTAEIHQEATTRPSYRPSTAISTFELSSPIASSKQTTETFHEASYQPWSEQNSSTTIPQRFHSAINTTTPTT